ncbi:MAG TPA: glycosyltransferase [Candidatus Aerophobetes bacterium]|uniref:Glycosyltransferase n=1 Tax=Aerophobetes bacterium TaxID=2030807 RepID=A0A7C1QWX1_UNCAE|nr:glycosyltransferase [Candidatus Aerophobetes bacterium]
MHILHLTPYMSLGGTERHILNLMAQGLSRGYQVSLASPAGEGLREVPDAVRLYQIENWRGLKLLRSVKALKEIILAVGNKVDLVQVHASAEMAYLTKKYLARKPVIFTCHGYNTHPPYFNYWLAARFLRRIDCIVALTPEEKEYFLRGGIKESKLIVISNGVEEKFFRAPSSHQDDGEVIGLVGRLVKEKNFSWAVKMQAKYRFASKLFVVGEGPYCSKLEKLVKRLNLEKKVIFLGYKEEMEKIYPLFTYLLISSRKEAFALVILEALAAGVPVLVPHWLFGVREFYGSAPGVVVFKGGKDLKQKVEKGEGKIMGDRIQSFARNFLWGNIFDRYEELYSHLLIGSEF